MKENEINNNDINIKLDKILEKCELLEKQNNENLQKNILIMKIFNNQLKCLRKEFKEELEELKTYYTQLFKAGMKIFLKEDNDNNKIKAEILKDNEIDFLENIKNKNEEENNNIDKKYNKLKEGLLNLFKKKQNKNDEEKKEDKNEEKKENEIVEKKEEKNEIIEYKGKNLLVLIETKLTNIFFDENPTIDINTINEMKKISSAIIIKKADPLMIMNQFFDKNFNKNFDEMDEKFRDNIAIKKTKIFGSLQDISLLKKIETKDPEKYMKEFREKFGISEEDFNEKDLKKLITKKKFEDKAIITEILKKLKYL